MEIAGREKEKGGISFEEYLDTLDEDGIRQHISTLKSGLNMYNKMMADGVAEEEIKFKCGFIKEEAEKMIKELEEKLEKFLV